MRPPPYRLMFMSVREHPFVYTSALICLLLPSPHSLTPCLNSDRCPHLPSSACCSPHSLTPCLNPDRCPHLPSSACCSPHSFTPCLTPDRCPHLPSSACCSPPLTPCLNPDRCPYLLVRLSLPIPIYDLDLLPAPNPTSHPLPLAAPSTCCPGVRKAVGPLP